MTTKQRYKSTKKPKVMHYVKNSRDFDTGHENAASLDTEIQEAVTLLNNKGYTTIASCAGHSDDKDSVTGYIWFQIPPSQEHEVPKDAYWECEYNMAILRWPVKEIAESELTRIQTQLLFYAINLPVR